MLQPDYLEAALSTGGVRMRFGIMTMQLQSLVPHGSSAAEAMANLPAFDYAKLVRSLAEAGFRVVELGGDLPLFMPQTFQPPSISALAELKQELDLALTVHLPLWSVEPSTPLDPVRRGSVEAVIHIIQASEPLSPEVYVLHATGALAAEFYRMNISASAKPLLLRLLQSKAEESLERILSETKIPSRKLALETIEFPFELTLELAETLDTSICLDTGHVLVGFSGPVTIDQVLEKSASRLAEVHLHDGTWQGPECNIGYGLDHRPLGTGDLQVGPFLDRLEALEFGGPIIFELQLDEALQSMEVIRQVRPNLV
jgi:sugar phosphate isomerase/epimerase